MITGEGESRNFNNPTIRSHFLPWRSQPGRVGTELHITIQFVQTEASATLAESQAMRRLAPLTCLDEKSMFGAAEFGVVWRARPAS